MSYTASAATETAVSASISTPVRPTVRTLASIASESSPSGINETSTPFSGSG